MEKKTFAKVRAKTVNSLDYKQKEENSKDKDKEIGFQVLNDEDIPF
ncbi:hypothetical protein [Clostridioides sp. GD02404]